MGLLKLPNFYAIGLAVIIGGMIVVGIFRTGANYNEGKHARATEKVNTVIVGQRGKDEAELSAEAAKAKEIDDAVKAALNQRFILDPDTAKLLGAVK